MDRRVTLVVLVAVVVAGGLWLRQYFAPEKVIERSFLKAVAAFEGEKLLATMSVVDRAYRDEFGQSYESLAGHIRAFHETFDDLEVVLEPPIVQVQDDEASLRIRFILWGTVDGQRGYALGRVGDACAATIEWRKQPQGWRISSTGELRIPELQSELDRARQVR